MKFGAFALGRNTPPGQLSLLAAIAQRAFLAGQRVALLPLDRYAQLQLRYLGIGSLGQ